MVQAGMKDDEQVSKRKRAGYPPRDVSQYGERVEEVFRDVSSSYELVSEIYFRNHLLRMQGARKREAVGSTPTLTI